MNNLIIIRKMVETDLPDVHKMELLSHPAPWTFALVEEQWRHTQYHFAYVAEQTDKKCLTGYCFIWGWEGVDMTISNIGVHIDYRRRGIGSLLMDKIIETAIAEKCPSVLLEVRESNTIAQAMYKKYGFEQVSKRRDYYAGPNEDGLVLRLRLPVLSDNKED